MNRIVMNLLLVNDTSTNPNQGCQATMHMLNRLLRREYPEASIRRVFLSTINYPFTSQEQQELLPSHITSVDRSLTQLLGAELPVMRDLVEKVEWADLVVINGEGSVLEDQPNAKMIYMTCELAHYFKKECHLINFTGHVTRSASVELAARAFDRCASIAVREPLSFYVVRRFFNRVKLFPDVVSGLDVATTDPPPSQPFVMLGGGSATLRMIGGRPRRAVLKRLLGVKRHTRRMDWLTEAYAAVCSGLVERGVQVRLMGWKRDEWLQHLEGPSVVYDEQDFVQYFNLCRYAQVNLSGRHHGCVMSFAAGCPFITTTANCFKNYGDRLVYGSPGQVLEMESFDSSLALRMLDAVLDEPQVHRHTAEQRRLELAPFFHGAVTNLRTPTADLVDAGLVPAEPRPGDLHFVQNMEP